MLSDEHADAFRRTEKDVVWNESRTTARCRNCGNPVMEVGPDNFMCIEDPGCLQALQEDGEERDCAPEGYSYAVMGPDQ